MTVDYLIDLIDEGHEIEFVWENKKFSITYGKVDGKEVISFCEFYKESTEVTCIDDLLTIKRYGMTVADMIEAITDDDMKVY